MLLGTWSASYLAKASDKRNLVGADAGSNSPFHKVLTNWIGSICKRGWEQNPVVLSPGETRRLTAWYLGSLRSAIGCSRVLSKAAQLVRTVHTIGASCVKVVINLKLRQSRKVLATFMRPKCLPSIGVAGNTHCLQKWWVIPQEVTMLRCGCRHG